MSWNVHGHHQIDILALDPEDCQEDGDFVGYELDAFEDRWGRGFAPPVVRRFGDTFYRAKDGFIIVSQGVEMEPRRSSSVVSPVEMEGLSNFAASSSSVCVTRSRTSTTTLIEESGSANTS